MESRLGLRRLLRWVLARATPAAPDAADAGTAFGMELALEDEQREPAAAPRELEARSRAAPPRRRSTAR
jgi:hypothetical protein